ncbi:MAG: hypothetical protein MUO31_14590 [Thermodesulfovibrionales bacterium]|nr:hypothetical protein [Thermodesulfovibrionales bacterium]
MDDVLKGILEYPLSRSTHKQKREEILKNFPVLKSSMHNNFLILNNYLIQSPQRFFLKSVCQLYSDFLESRHHKMGDALKEYIFKHEAELNGALLNLEEINKYNWHDNVISNKNFQLLRFINQTLHPTYLKMVESVLCPLLRIAAHFSRIDRKAGTEGLDIYQIVAELKNTNLYETTKPYNHIMRNGIAHGGIVYLQNEIKYYDKGEEEKKDDREIIKIFDDLVDVCNALIIALIVFLLIHQSNYCKLPQQLLIYELIEETKNPWWEIEGCVPQELTKISQLNIFARSKTSDFRKNQFFAVQSCLLAGMFSPEYDRYFLSIDSEKSNIGYLSFNGKKLRNIPIQQNARIEDYLTALEDIAISRKHNKYLKTFYQINAVLMSFKLHWEIIKSKKRSISVRISKIHRNGWGLVLNSKVFIENPNGEITKDYIKRWCRKIVSKSLKHARRQRSIIKFFRYLPLGYAHISVFRKDYRRRRLADFGLESDLVCVIQIKKIKRIRCPDIYKSETELFRKYHIAWNRSWLEEISAKN